MPNTLKLFDWFVVDMEEPCRLRRFLTEVFDESVGQSAVCPADSGPSVAAFALTLRDPHLHRSSFSYKVLRKDQIRKPR